MYSTNNYLIVYNLTASYIHGVIFVNVNWKVTKFDKSGKQCNVWIILRIIISDIHCIAFVVIAEQGSHLVWHGHPFT